MIAYVALLAKFFITFPYKTGRYKDLKNPSTLSFQHLGNWILLGLVAGLLFLLFNGDLQITGLSQNSDNPSDQLTGYSRAVSAAAPAVVSIQALQFVQDKPKNTGDLLLDRFLSPSSPHAPKVKTSISNGSGVILDARGYILTNYHVIADADVVRISLHDGRETIASLIGNDPETDLAVLKINIGELPQVKIADIRQLQIGDVALAIGYPFRIGQTVTQGIISATGRTQVSGNTYENFLQTDAAINPGNSGGALVNVNGEIIGINSLIFTRTGGFNGIGFAIPIDLAKTVLEQIAQHGYVVRGWLGVGGLDLSSEILMKIGLPDIRGVLVTDVDKNGPGDKAGLKQGDIITKINDTPLTSVRDILNIVAAGKPGDIFTITGLRKRQSFMINAELGQRPTMSRE